jgi:hypothetical protein
MPTTVKTFKDLKVEITACLFLQGTGYPCNLSGENSILLFGWESTAGISIIPRQTFGQSYQFDLRLSAGFRF